MTTRGRPEHARVDRPAALFREMREVGNRACVMEATSMAAAKGRLGGTRFAVLVFTNLTQDHLDFHGTMDDYFESKRRLFGAGRARRDQRRGRVRRAPCGGDPRRRPLSPSVRRRRRGRPGATSSTLRRALRPAVSRSSCAGASTSRTRSRRPRRPSARPRRGGDQRGIELVERVPGRFDSVDEGQPFIVLVDYAHTPGALEASCGPHASWRADG